MKHKYIIVGYYGDYTIRIPLSGGKAGKGYNVTSSVQVCNRYKSTIIKQFRFQMKEPDSRIKAIERAKTYYQKVLK